MTSPSKRIFELVCRDRFGAAPCGRPDIPDEIENAGITGITIQTDAGTLSTATTIQPDTSWSQHMVYLIFPNGLCLQFEQDKIIRLFYIEDQPSSDERAIKYFLREASRFCDDITLTSLDPAEVLGRFSEWRHHTVIPEEIQLLNNAETLTQSLHHLGPPNFEIADIMEFIKRDDWTE
jgi:hypothetical protein